MDPDTLDRLAAALTVLARLQLRPADETTRAQVVSLAGQWPLSDAEPETAEARLARVAGWDLLIGSQGARETDEEVRRDQDRVYGITARAVVPPFESVHRNEEGLVFDAATLEVRGYYARAGLRAPELNREPDDHLGLELDFLARCCTAALDALDRGDEGVADAYLAVAQEFVQLHLLAWAPAILERARAAADTRWLRGLEDLTLSAVLTLAAALDAGEAPRDDQGSYTVVRAMSKDSGRTDGEVRP
ncbi:TorD/DmsD family molecular chaperone [Actinomyces haliotis]|uniref:TorD/DmsD family molecular chaperone n=1 Tax=Actinomyces haliotis TaxID=1280843 RepID=UPI0018901A64|nr:molecular chaperone TorD family protein [Actinomyces haliotis]